MIIRWLTRAHSGTYSFVCGRFYLSHTKNGAVKFRSGTMQPDHSKSRHSKQPVGILGATGMVGQRFIQLLENSPVV